MPANATHSAIQQTSAQAIKIGLKNGYYSLYKRLYNNYITADSTSLGTPLKKSFELSQTFAKVQRYFTFEGGYIKLVMVLALYGKNVSNFSMLSPTFCTLFALFFSKEFR